MGVFLHQESAQGHGLADHTCSLVGLGKVLPKRALTVQILSSLAWPWPGLLVVMYSTPTTGRTK